MSVNRRKKNRSEQTVENENKHNAEIKMKWTTPDKITEKVL